MWGSGAARRRQQLAVKEMVTAACASQNYQAPWRSSPAVWEHFRSEAEILTHVQKTWRNALAGAIYVAIEQGTGEMTAEVSKAFDTISRRHAGIRRILEANRDHPAIRAAMAKEASLLSSLVEGDTVTPSQARRAPRRRGLTTCSPATPPPGPRATQSIGVRWKRAADRDGVGPRWPW